jgi:putative N6-adenine-specific DNA methylase
MPFNTLSCFAITAPGLEAITANELRALGIVPDEQERGGVAWKGALESLYTANLWLRTASRVIVRIGEFRATSFAELERRAKRVPWHLVLSPNRPVRFRVTCRKSRLYHSDAVAQRLSDAVRPSVGSDVSVGVLRGSDEQDTPDAQIFIVRLEHDNVTISADSSGALLHRRGYRQAVAKAPLRETMAAAMLLASGWDLHSPLVDPMCGSGTIPIEAALLARKIAPGRARSFSFTHWPNFDDHLWKTLVARARDGELDRAPGIIRGSDRDAGAARSAFANAERAGVAADVDITHCAISDAEPAGGRGWIVTNPPYGVRIGDTKVRNLYAQFGKVIRHTFPGWVVGILSADRTLERQVGITFDQSFATSNGGIPVRFVVAGA